jgi:membrane-bound serine protease (ClpP class)
MRRLLAVLLIGLGLLGPVAAAAQSARPVLVARVDGAIIPVQVTYVDRAIDRAEELNAAALVLQMDTPGGLDSSMRQIIQRIIASRVPVIVYVAPGGARAASAGVYITYASHLAAMTPGTNIGSATPVQLGENGEQQVSTEMRAKLNNDAVAYIRGLAQQRGRNADWAEQAVREAANVTAEQARDQKIVEIVATDLDDLLRQANGRTVQTAAGPVVLQTAGAPIEMIEPTPIETLLKLVTDPTVAYLLLSLGSLGLFLELSNPGSILPGVVGGIFLLLALYALGTLPVNYAGAALMAFAFLLFAADVFTSSHGVLTAGGVVSFLLGSLLLFNTPEGAPFLQVSLSAVIAVTLAFALFFGFVVGAVLRARRRRPVTGREGLIGQVGEVREPLDPRGMIFVSGELWRAVSPAGPVPAGTQVEVLAINGLTLTVRPLLQAPPAPTPAAAPS